jgi:hypothetical protein
MHGTVLSPDCIARTYLSFARTTTQFFNSPDLGFINDDNADAPQRRDRAWHDPHTFPGFATARRACGGGVRASSVMNG